MNENTFNIIIIIIIDKMLYVGVFAYSERVQGHAGRLHEVQYRQEAKQGNEQMKHFSRTKRLGEI